MTGGESGACIDYAQRRRISDVSPMVERGMGHRLPIVLRLTAEQPQCGLNIDVITARAVHRCWDSYRHRFGENDTLGLKRYHRTHSHPVFIVIE